MAIDLRRVLEAAVDAATQPAQTASQLKPKKSRLPAGKAILLGAGVVTAGRVIAGPTGRRMLESVQERLEEIAHSGQDPDADELDVDPEAEADEEFDEEEDFEEPEAEADDDNEEAYEDEEEPEPEEPDDEERPRRPEKPRASRRGR